MTGDGDASRGQTSVVFATVQVNIHMEIAVALWYSIKIEILFWSYVFMNISSYHGALTAEQFLFYEIRIVSRFFLQGVQPAEAIQKITSENLFQYPTEREIARMTRACYRRLDALGNDMLIHEISVAPLEIAKQINLYAIMRYNRLVWDFMIQVIGEKFRTQDFSFNRKDINDFFSHLQAQNDSVAGWSDNTINKIKSVLVRCLVETEYLDHFKSTTLNPVFLCEELEQGIRENNDTEALPAFNCFR